MAGNLLSKAVQLLLPKGKPKVGGNSLTATTTPSNSSAVIAAPAYQDHLTDIMTSRQSNDARALIQSLATQDPDVSAAFNAFLTTANTEMQVLAYAPDNTVDPNGITMATNVITMLTTQDDYTGGFYYRPSKETISENMRYMCLMRGMVLCELVFDKNLAPTEIRQIEPMNIYWWEKTPGQYKPELRQNGLILELDFPSIFASFHHRDPTTIYPASSFVSAINTIAARQQIVNDLYRIMQITGYPRLDVAVLEEVILKNAPANVKKDPKSQREWVNARLADAKTAVQDVRPDQALVHFDSMTIKTVNDKAAGMSLNITPVIDMLNAQNQAALKVMATVIGRGESGVNTASVEARIFTMNCDELNVPVAECWSNILTLACRMQGYQGRIVIQFRPAELRPKTELEPQLLQKAARLKEDLSLGVITDEEYTLEMYGRLPNPGAPVLSGTGFMQQQTSAGLADAAAASSGGTGPSSGQPNSVDRAAAPKGSKAAKSNTVKKAA